MENFKILFKKNLKLKFSLYKYFVIFLLSKRISLMAEFRKKFKNDKHPFIIDDDDGYVGFSFHYVAFFSKKKKKIIKNTLAKIISQQQQKQK